MSARSAHDAIPVGGRTAAVLVLSGLAGLLAFTWPLLVQRGSALEHSVDAPLVLAGVLVAVLACVVVSVADGGVDVKAVALLGLLSAVGAVLRPLSAGTGGVELVFAVLVLGGRVLGPGFGFALGSTTILTSALLTGGVGPWMPFQMLAASWVGLGAGLLLPRVRGRAETAVLVGYGAVASLAYGLLMNLTFWPFQVGAGTGLSFVAGDPVTENLGRFLVFSAVTSLGWDVGRAVTTVLVLLALGRPLLPVLRRAATRARFVPDASRGRDTPVDATRRGPETLVHRAGTASTAPTCADTDGCG
ncbi:ECF transporter S component [Cellulomonas carbonis]|uniref:ECF transporter S component n=1 Tax=Cellulomonas carbonis TaxID=1386092 RepID=UPI0009E040A2|nr:ECF transporter S component [Cellulomonas carbonis]GGB94715.1 ABC transporter permease [Cellulomonas carbonis]